MTDKQITIDYENLCANYSKEVGCYNTFDGSCIKEQCFTYRLLQLLKAKEQECEALQMSENEAGEIIAELEAYKDINEDFKTAWEELKAENEELKKNLNEGCLQHLTLMTEQQVLLKTITEIKEIAEIEIECKTYEIENDCFNETRCKALNEHIDFIKQILQKISECEVEKYDITCENKDCYEGTLK